MSETPDRWAEPRRVTETGRAALAEAASMDRDWGLQHSAQDKLIEMLAGLSDEDLDSAYFMAHNLREAIVCIQIRRDTERLPR